MFTMRRYEINIKQKKEECKIIRKFAFMIQLYITRHGQTEENQYNYGGSYIDSIHGEESGLTIERYDIIV